MPEKLKLGLIPGPEEIPPIFCSQDLEEITSYPAWDVIHFLSTLPDMIVLEKGRLDQRKSYYNWLWRWQTEKGILEIGMTLLDEGQTFFWGGSPLIIHCPLETVCQFWDIFHHKFPAAWLHDELDLDLLSGPDLLEKYDLVI